jgi:branched-chain amino acid transport system ATP-binding protein
MSVQIVLESRDLTKKFGGITAIDKFNFSMKEGELKCLIGPNGAGKTTFFNLVCGILKPTSGRIFYKGIDITNMPPHKIARLGIGRSYQVPKLFNNLTVYENIRVVVQHRRETLNIFKSVNDFKEVDERAEDILKILELDAKADMLAQHLSHGEKKKLDVGLALAQEPSLLLLDEPTAGMNIRETSEMANLIKRIKKGTNRGISVLVVEHDMKFIRDIAETVTVMHKGKIIAEGSVSEIEKNQDVINIYLGAGTV